jgi:DNA-binding NarL/FixJ family response regulator
MAPVCAGADHQSVKNVERGGPQARHTCVLVDDHPEVLSSLASLLEHEGLEVVGRAATGAEALRLLELHRPAVAVLDLRLPDLSGIEVARAAARIAPETAIVVHTGEAHASTVGDALAAGVLGVVLKAVPPWQLLEALDAALAGEVHVDPSLARISS